MVNNPRLGPISRRAGSFLPVFRLVPLLVGVGLFGSFSYGDETISFDGSRYSFDHRKSNRQTIQIADEVRVPPAAGTRYTSAPDATSSASIKTPSPTCARS